MRLRSRCSSPCFSGWPARHQPGQVLGSAKEYLQKNDLKSATIQVKNALQIDPDQAEARFPPWHRVPRRRGRRPSRDRASQDAAAKHPADDSVVPELAKSVLIPQAQSRKVVDEFGRMAPGPGPLPLASLQTTLAAGARPSGPARPGRRRTGCRARGPIRIMRRRSSSAPGKGSFRKDFAAALAIVGEVLAKDPRNAEAWKLKGDLSLFIKDKALQIRSRPTASRWKSRPSSCRHISRCCRR